MRICPQCRTNFDDDYVFCLADGNALVDGETEQETVVNRKVWMPPPAPESGSPVFCASCGFENRSHSKFCKKCGGPVAGASIPPPPAPPQFEFSGFEVNVPSAGVSLPGQYGHDLVPQPPNYPTPQNTVTNRGSNKGVIIGLGVGGGVLLSLIVFLMLGIGSGSKGVSSTNANNKDSAASQNGFDSGLPKSFDRRYEGVIAGKGLSMSLKRDGPTLTGTALTTKSDELTGKIDDNGDFDLNAYENGSNYTGIFSGHIFTDGTVSGNWTNTEGKKATPFSLHQQ